MFKDSTARIPLKDEMKPRCWKPKTCPGCSQWFRSVDTSVGFSYLRYVPEGNCWNKAAPAAKRARIHSLQ